MGRPAHFSSSASSTSRRIRSTKATATAVSSSPRSSSATQRLQRIPAPLSTPPSLQGAEIVSSSVSQQATPPLPPQTLLGVGEGAPEHEDASRSPNFQSTESSLSRAGLKRARDVTGSSRRVSRVTFVEEKEADDDEWLHLQVLKSMAPTFPPTPPTTKRFSQRTDHSNEATTRDRLPPDSRPSSPLSGREREQKHHSVASFSGDDTPKPSSELETQRLEADFAPTPLISHRRASTSRNTPPLGAVFDPFVTLNSGHEEAEDSEEEEEGTQRCDRRAKAHRTAVVQVSEYASAEDVVNPFCVSSTSRRAASRGKPAGPSSSSLAHSKKRISRAAPQRSSRERTPTSSRKRKRTSKEEGKKGGNAEAPQQQSVSWRPPSLTSAPLRFRDVASSHRFAILPFWQQKDTTVVRNARGGNATSSAAVREERERLEEEYHLMVDLVRQLGIPLYDWQVDPLTLRMALHPHLAVMEEEAERWQATPRKRGGKQHPTPKREGRRNSSSLPQYACPSAASASTLPGVSPRTSGGNGVAGWYPTHVIVHPDTPLGREMVWACALGIPILSTAYVYDVLSTLESEKTGSALASTTASTWPSRLPDILPSRHFHPLLQSCFPLVEQLRTQNRDVVPAPPPPSSVSLSPSADAIPPLSFPVKDVISVRRGDGHVDAAEGGNAPSSVVRGADAVELLSLDTPGRRHSSVSTATREFWVTPTKSSLVGVPNPDAPFDSGMGKAPSHGAGCVWLASPSRLALMSQLQRGLLEELLPAGQQTERPYYAPVFLGLTVGVLQYPEVVVDEDEDEEGRDGGAVETHPPVRASSSSSSSSSSCVGWAESDVCSWLSVRLVKELVRVLGGTTTVLTLTDVFTQAATETGTALSLGQQLERAVQRQLQSSHKGHVANVWLDLTGTTSAGIRTSTSGASWRESPSSRIAAPIVNASWFLTTLLGNVCGVARAQQQRQDAAIATAKKEKGRKIPEEDAKKAVVNAATKLAKANTFAASYVSFPYLLDPLQECWVRPFCLAGGGWSTSPLTHTIASSTAQGHSLNAPQVEVETEKEDFSHLDEAESVRRVSEAAPAPSVVDETTNAMAPLEMVSVVEDKPDATEIKLATPAPPRIATSFPEAFFGAQDVIHHNNNHNNKETKEVKQQGHGEENHAWTTAATVHPKAVEPPPLSSFMPSTTTKRNDRAEDTRGGAPDDGGEGWTEVFSCPLTTAQFEELQRRAAFLLRQKPRPPSSSASAAMRRTFPSLLQPPPPSLFHAPLRDPQSPPPYEELSSAILPQVHHTRGFLATALFQNKTEEEEEGHHRVDPFESHASPTLFLLPTHGSATSSSSTGPPPPSPLLQPLPEAQGSSTHACSSPSSFSSSSAVLAPSHHHTTRHSAPPLLLGMRMGTTTTTAAAAVDDSDFTSVRRGRCGKPSEDVQPAEGHPSMPLRRSTLETEERRGLEDDTHANAQRMIEDERLPSFQTSALRRSRDEKRWPSQPASSGAVSSPPEHRTGVETRHTPPPSRDATLASARPLSSVVVCLEDDDDEEEEEVVVYH